MHTSQKSQFWENSFPQLKGNASKIGIIANPSSGQDLRRLVSKANTVTQLEKVNLLSRLFSGLQSMGDFQLYYMPERLYLVQQALESSSVKPLVVKAVPDLIEGGPQDTVTSVKQMVSEGVNLIVTLGGDGTNRLVAESSFNVPILPLSTGTNNVFPEFHEGSRAGLAAGVFLRGLAQKKTVSDFCRPHKYLKASSDDFQEVALVDFALSKQKQLGGRAVWKPEQLTHLFASRSTPGDSGISGILGSMMEVSTEDPFGVYAITGMQKRVQGFMVAGVLEEFGLDHFDRMQLDESICFHVEEGSLLADGERIRTLHDQSICFSLHEQGPWVLDVDRTLSYGLEEGFFQV